MLIYFYNYDNSMLINKIGIMPSFRLNSEDLRKLDAYWRASNYLAVGQIYLLNNPLLKKSLTTQDIKPRLLGHWGTSPGLNFIYTHLNQMIKHYDLDMIFLAGPGHGAPAVIAQTYLEGTYTEFYPDISQDEEGMRKLFRQFSFPGGIPSHAAPETPGSIHEGGELGYVLTHAYGAAFDNPELIVCAVVGDGEAETGPLAASWHSNKFLNPATDGAVLPILHLNGYKIASATFLSRIPKKELQSLLEGYGYRPYFVKGDDPQVLHPLMAETLSRMILEIKEIQKQARSGSTNQRPTWPMLVLETPKGWTCPKTVDHQKLEGSWRSHQVPITHLNQPEHLALLQEWMKSYRPEELFDEKGRLRVEIAEMAPKGLRRMGANPHANGGILLKDLRLPDFRDYAVKISSHGTEVAESARALGPFLRDIMTMNNENRNFRLFGPDETSSNRLEAVFQVTDRMLNAEILPTDEQLSNHGRVTEVLSEHLCEGWLEGYLLTGRHGFFSCYEAFIHIIVGMFNQHAKWLKTSRMIAWRRPIASLNYFLTSHVWRQDHNGFSHQDPGFIDHVVNKKAEIIRVYLPPDANTLLSVTDHCLRSKNYINVIVCGKQPALQYLSMDEAVKHCNKGVGIWTWASNDYGHEPDVVMTCAGDIPTMETLAAVELLRQHAPSLKIRVVNIVDLMVLEPNYVHPHGLSDREFDDLFTVNKPVIFAFHGYPWLIHRLTYKRKNHDNMHVHGYIEEGTTTTPFNMAVLNQLDRYHLFMSAVKNVPKLESVRAYLRQVAEDQLLDHKFYIEKYGEDKPEIKDWKWKGLH